MSKFNAKIKVLMLYQLLWAQLVEVVHIKRMSRIIYSGDLKSNHLKFRLFEGQISNGWALAMDITIGGGSIRPKPDSQINKNWTATTC